MSYDDDDRPPRKRSSSNWLWIAVIGASVTLGIGVLACCGGLAYFGLNITAAEVENQLRDNPTLREHIGEIQSFKMNIVRSAAADGDDTWVYDVVGSKASGQITVLHVTGFDGEELVRSASLRLKDGTVVELIEDETPSK